MPRKKKRRPASPAPAGVDRKELAAMYGWALATLNSSKELSALFDQAVKKNYTPAKFVAELRSTKWFQKKSESQRKYIVLKTSDPAQFRSVVNQRITAISDLWGQMGGSRPTRQLLAKMADQSIRLGLTDEQITEKVSSAINWKQNIARNTLRGNGASNMMQLKKMAAQNGIRLSNNWYASALENIAGNDATLEGYQNSIKEYAKKRYVQYADQLDGGMTIEQIMEPYRQSMAELLEMNPNNIDAFSPYMQQALSHKEKNTAGAMVPAQMSLSEFEDRIRQTTKWQYTQNAHDTVDKMTNDLLTRWGLKA